MRGMEDYKDLDQMVDVLSASPFFAGAPRKALEDLVIDSDIIRFSAGEVIMREGEYEEICYVTLSGRFKISVTDKNTGAKRVVRILGAGEILGEMSVLTGRPRLAEVACLNGAQALRAHKEELARFLDAAPEVKKRIDDDYRARALSSVLRKIDVFSLVDDMSMADLARKVELVTRKKGEPVFRAGEAPEAFYLVRDGFVKLSRRLEDEDSAFFDSRFDKATANPFKKPGEGEFTMAYLGTGSYFGERALLDGRPRLASATAVTRAELVKIKKEDFEDLMRRHPLVRDKLAAMAASRYAEAGRVDKFRFADQEMLSWVEKHDILGADSILLLDLDLCVRCLHCIDVCAALHGGVSRITHNGIRFKNILIPTSCRHCREPTCMIGCPTGAIKRDLNGEVYHTDACIGCGNCARRCPFGNISIVEVGAGRRRAAAKKGGWLKALLSPGAKGEEAVEPEVRRRAVKCDLCMGYDYIGCEHNCPTGAIMSVKPSEYFARLAERKG